MLLCGMQVGFGQGNPPTIKPCDKEQYFCAFAKEQSACFEIDLEGYSQPISKFEIKWGDGQTETIPFTDPLPQVNHIYSLRNWDRDCPAPEEYFPDLQTITVANPDRPLRSINFISFRFPPKSRFSIRPGNTACVGDLVTVSPTDCNQTEDLFDFGQGPGAAKTFTYDTPGTYTITHAVTGECGQAASTQTITILDKPAAVAEAIQGVTIQGDPLTVCLDGASAQVIISGVKSAGATSYQWTIPSGVAANQRGRTPVDTLTFRTVGEYTVRLRVDNDCRSPSTAELTFKVVAAPQLRLTPVADACEPVNYTPSPLIPGAAYTINGSPQTTWPFRAGFGSYAVVAKLSNECGDQEVTDDFTVAAPAEITVTSPTAPTAVVCADSGPITLAATPAGGTWTGSPDIRVLPEGVQLVPTTPGTYTLTYRTGSGACAKTATRVITVETLTLTLNPQADQCLAIDYTPSPRLTGASYLVDGQPVTTFPIRLDFGQHTVEATQTNTCGTTTERDTFEVTAPREISVQLPTVADTAVCVGSGAVRLRASLGGGRWTGAPGIRSTGDAAATFDPTTAGRFTLTYTRGEGACARSSSVTVDVQGVAVAPQPISACAGAASVALRNPVPGGAWSSPSCPTCVTDSTFTFPAGGAVATGSYAVVYRLTNATGCAGSASTSIEVLDPRAAFDVPPVQCLGVPIDPNVPSSTSGQTLRWTIDGRTATPPFVGLDAGAYTIEATATLASCSDVSALNITVIAPPPPVEIVADEVRGCGPLEVTLTLQGADPTGVAYRWDLGRGPADTTSGARLAAPVTFTNLTIDTLRYTVSVGGDNACGDGGDTQDIIVYPQPLAEIGTDSAFSGCSPYRVLFSNRGSRNVDQCRYYGVDGLDIRDCRDTFSLSLTAVGQSQVYPVIIEATNACGTDLDTALITVLPPGITPLFNLDDLDYTVCPGEPLVFSDASTPRPTILEWDLGDGTRSTSDTVRHRYAAADTSFAVRLRVSSGCGYAEQERTVTVLPRPAGELSVPSFACAEEEVSVTVTTPAPAIELTFGNGQRSGAAFAKTRYDSAGSYTVRLTLRSALGCEDSLQASITVNPLPELEVVGGDTACVGQTLRVSAGGPNVQTVAWRFPNGDVASGVAATWVPPSAGVQVGSVLGRTTAGCVDSATFQLFARDTPSAGFSVSGDSTCVPMEIAFLNASTGPGITSYGYSFGEGGSAVVASGAYTYRQGGVYTVEQIVGIDGLCFDTSRVRVRALALPDLQVALVDDRCLPSEAAFLDVRTGEGETIGVTGPGLDTVGGTRIAIVTPGRYVVTASTRFGCDTSAVFELAARIPLDLELLRDTSLRFGDSLRLTSQVNYADLDYLWVPNEGFRQNEIAAPWVRPVTSTTYELSVSSGRCVAAKTVRITVVERGPVDAPTAFSPNGDGINDVWELYPNASIERLRSLSVYTRWGELVYFTEGLGDWQHGGLPLKAWDGYSKGKKMNPAVYVWLLEAETFDGETQVLHGDLTVME